ncbi:hypothetical protein EXIGLDRAFT_731509, partial [Exidia glandulosa HHB12029]
MPSSFTLSTRATTDLWRKPPGLDVANAPSQTQSIPLASLKGVRVTVHADWERQYDQGGLVILTPDNKFWVKAGIEFFNGEPCVSCVATDAWSDWSVVPDLAPGGKATLEFAPAEGSLWLYLIKEGGKRVPLREITWFLTKQPDVVVDIGAYVARPTAKEGD